MHELPSRIVLLTGPARSGTTLLYRMLAGGDHHRVFPESSPVTALLGLSARMKWMPEAKLAAWFADEAGRLDTFRDMTAVLINRLLREEPTRDILFLKDPYLIDFHQECQKVFPHVPLISTIRDPLDILRSRARIAANKGVDYDLRADIDEVRLQIRRVRALAQSQSDSQNFALVGYETLVAKPDVVRQRLARFLKVDISPSLEHVQTETGDPFVTKLSGSAEVVHTATRGADIFSQSEQNEIRKALAFEIRYARNAGMLI